MAEPSTSISAGAVATGAVTIAGSIAGIPADVLFASVAGAALAMSANTKLEPKLSAVTKAAFVFALSLATAIFMGPALALLGQGLIEKLLIPMPLPPLRAAAAFFLALGAQRIMPAALDRFTSEIDRKGASNG